MPAANLSFLPWVRQGAAGAIATLDTLGPKQPAVADVSITLKVNTRRCRPCPYGCADPRTSWASMLTRWFARIHVRAPTTSSRTAFRRSNSIVPTSPGCSRPRARTRAAQLRPWLCLVVVRKQDGVQLASTVDSPLPMLSIAAPAKPFLELPDLKECWAWAHGQAAADDTSDPDGVGNALNGAPQLSLSRLVCPRLLTPNTDYIACVVPAFELGRKAGLGLTIADTELDCARTHSRRRGR